MADGLIGRAAEGVRRLPGIRQWRKWAFDRKFAANVDENLFRGVFDSAQAALASAPASRPLGYDNPASAELYLKRLAVDDHDYPAMFWLRASLAEGKTRIADLGGSVGIKYFAFAPLMDFPSDLVWHVIDVPEVVERGRRFAASRQAAACLTFSDRLGDADGVDVLLASGVLQYLPDTLAQILKTLPQKPARLIVNTAAIHPGKSFFTLNSIGTAYCAYRVQAFDEFVQEILACGYSLRDDWRNVGKQLNLPFEASASLRDYRGFCFDLDQGR